MGKQQGAKADAGKPCASSRAQTVKKHPGLKVVSLFSGCGGLDLGLKQAGHETILLCEKDPDAIQVLKKNFPGVKLETDVCTLKELPKETEILAAGFPCIDISRVGKQEGLDGEHSSLVHEVFRLLRKAKSSGTPVPWVIIENVEPLLHKSRDGKKPPVIHVIANELESIGYRSWAYRVISTAGFGIPQKRRRVIMVASMYSDARDVLLAQGRDECHECSYATQGDAEAMQCFECFQRGVGERFSQLKTPPERYAAKYAATSALSMDTNSALGVPSMDMVPTFTTQNFKMCISIPGKPLTMLRIEDAERLQGFPEGFTAVADGSLTDPKRHKLIGNAVSVPIARWVGLGIARPDLHKYFKTDQDMPLAPRYQREPSAWDFDEMDYITQLCGGLGWTSGDYSVAHWNDPSGDADSPEEGDADAQAARKHAIKEQSWPASGYWHIGGLRYGLADMSSVPVKLPFVPLGSFITKLGRLVTKADMDIYTNKLAGRGNKQTAYLIQHIRERGLNVTGDATGFVQFILRLLFSSW